MSLLKSLLATFALSLAATGCAISFPDYALGAGGSSSGSMSTGALMVTPCVPAACDPDALAADAAIDPMCGVFVSPGANGGDGSQGSPYGTLTTALMNDASQRPIYVCTGPSGLTEAVTLSGAIDLYGGFDCTSWKKSGTKTPWTADPNGVPLRITNSGFKECDGAFVDGFAITAKDATGADGTTHNGNSSIGAFVSGGFATLVNVDIVAGNGADGIAGAKNPMGVGNSANGQSGSACASGAGPTGAPPAPQMCNGSDVSGGKGGDGGMASGAKGGDGSGNLADIGYGVGSGGLTVPSGSCTQDEDGAPGLDGTVVGGGTSLGTLDSNGFQGASGEPGKDGQPGGGAGGGGGLAGNGANYCGVGVDGSGGGGGGAGGCAGLGGAGGGAGGASIALASFGGNVALKNVTLKAQQGGKGADGGDGQQGGAGGTPGQGACVGGACACNGGQGGKGGSGTAGGGGKGGSSFGIAFHGDMAPSIPDTAIIVSLSQATGGKGGTAPIGLSGDGDPGQNVKIQAFP